VQSGRVLRLDVPLVQAGVEDERPGGDAWREVGELDR
jgi:hypothetical protein